jgi:hypothetical protein
MSGIMIYLNNSLEIGVSGYILITFLSLPLLVLLFIRAGSNNKINTEKRIYGLDSMTAALYSLFTFLFCTALFLH